SAFLPICLTRRIGGTHSARNAGADSKPPRSQIASPTLHTKCGDASMRRHELTYLRPSGWRALLDARPDLAAQPLVMRWRDERWPLIHRRPMPHEPTGIALGLPLPGRRRLACIVRPEDFLAHTPPPTLQAVCDAAPLAWRRVLMQICELAARH